MLNIDLRRVMATIQLECGERICHRHKPLKLCLTKSNKFPEQVSRLHLTLYHIRNFVSVGSTLKKTNLLPASWTKLYDYSYNVHLLTQWSVWNSSMKHAILFRCNSKLLFCFKLTNWRFQSRSGDRLSDDASCFSHMWTHLENKFIYKPVSISS
jgi:hypothetical protein